MQKVLNAIFDAVRETSYRWGWPKWLQMRSEVMKSGGVEGWSNRKQRPISKLLRATDLEWLI